MPAAELDALGPTGTGGDGLPPGELEAIVPVRHIPKDFFGVVHQDAIVLQAHFLAVAASSFSSLVSCPTFCTFCAFYRKPGSAEGYVLSFEEMFKKVEETLELGGSGILMQGGLHPDLPLEWYEDLLRELKQRNLIETINETNA